MTVVKYGQFGLKICCSRFIVRVQNYLQYTPLTVNKELDSKLEFACHWSMFTHEMLKSEVLSSRSRIWSFNLEMTNALIKSY